jgi:hypothetical protein
VCCICVVRYQTGRQRGRAVTETSVGSPVYTASVLPSERIASLDGSRSHGFIGIPAA